LASENLVTNRYDVVIIGGGPAGLSLGISVRKHYKGKSVLLIREEEKNMVPCGIPYTFFELPSVDKNISEPKAFFKEGGKMVVDKVLDINRQEKKVRTANEEYAYDRLVFATGSKPIIPSFIKGYDSANVFYVHKDYNYIKALKEKVSVAKRIAIVGGGFIGVEIAEQISKSGKQVTLIELEQNCLSAVFSRMTCEDVEERIRACGIELCTGAKVTELKARNGVVSEVLLEDGRVLGTDLVILAMGYRPETDLAQRSGLKVNKFGAIRVDTYMRTDDRDIFAIGDCAQKIDFLTRRSSCAMLASIAGAESRVVASNIFSIKTMRHNLGTISIFSTAVDGKVYAAAGMSEKEAKKQNISFVIGAFQGYDKHPLSLKGTNRVNVKLLVTKESASIIGAEVMGGVACGEVINAIGIVIQAKLDIHELYSYQIGTHPLLTGGPTVYPLMKAIEASIAQLREGD
jgi:NADH oxidase (H2O2-forming)